ncbi:conserved Plasmodium protein, unknown function [Plasmodium relictum]|uniref:Uncharacterized protein n=1 Tax=Plasmodium relictum TaxID=85471 RepID=A0A1J1HI87_PLARL|nr:conserved Plasmodium protein, unknown function [Plasmodium relictum]CRH03981.1 conserved Plasmodium protein, unknown function [Plasmodium relictum]
MVYKNFTDVIENKKLYVEDDYYDEKNIKNKMTYDTKNKSESKKIRNNELFNNYSYEVKKKLKDNSLNHYYSDQNLSVLNNNDDTQEKHLKSLKDSRNLFKKLSQKEIEKLRYKYKNNDYYGMPYSNIYEKRHTCEDIKNKYNSLNYNKLLINDNDNESLYSYDDTFDKNIIDSYNDSLLSNRDFNNLNKNNFKIFNYERKKNGNRANENLEYCKKIINNNDNYHNEQFSPLSDNYDKYKLHNLKSINDKYDNLKSNHNYGKFLSENYISNNYRKSLGSINQLEEDEEKKKYSQDKKNLFETFLNVTEKLEKIKNTKINKHKRNQGLEKERNGFYSNSMDNIIKERLLHEKSLNNNFYNRKKYNTSFYDNETGKEYGDLSDLKNYIKKFSPLKNTILVNGEDKEKLSKGDKFYDDILKYNSVDSFCYPRGKDVLKKVSRENFDNDLIKEKYASNKLSNPKKKSTNLDSLSLTSNNLKSTQLHMSAISHGTNDYSTLYDYVNYTKNQTKDYYYDENMHNLSKSSYIAKYNNNRDIEKNHFLNDINPENYKNDMKENYCSQLDKLGNSFLEINNELKSNIYTPKNFNIGINNNYISFDDQLIDKNNNKVDDNCYDLNNRKNIKNISDSKRSLIHSDNCKKKNSINNILNYEESENKNENNIYENEYENENIIESIGKKYIFKDDEKLNNIFDLKKKDKINKGISINEENEEKYNLKKVYENEMNTNNNKCDVLYHNTNNNDTSFCNYLKNRSYTRPMNIDDLNLDENNNNIEMKYNLGKNNLLNCNTIFLFILIYFLKLLYLLFSYLIHFFLFFSIYCYHFLRKKSLKTVVISILIAILLIMFVISIVIFSYRSMSLEYFDKDI